MENRISIMSVNEQILYDSLPIARSEKPVSDALKQEISSLSRRLNYLLDLAEKGEAALPEGFCVARVVDWDSSDSRYTLPEGELYSVVPNELGDAVKCYVNSYGNQIRHEDGRVWFASVQFSKEEAAQNFLLSNYQENNSEWFGSENEAA